MFVVFAIGIVLSSPPVAAEPGDVTLPPPAESSSVIEHAWLDRAEVIVVGQLSIGPVRDGALCTLRVDEMVLASVVDSVRQGQTIHCSGDASLTNQDRAVFFLAMGQFGYRVLHKSGAAAHRLSPAETACDR